jgi:hypothetical protein
MTKYATFTTSERQYVLRLLNDELCRVVGALTLSEDKLANGVNSGRQRKSLVENIPRLLFKRDQLTSIIGALRGEADNDDG